jgi:flagellar biosynthetic protein FlhB
LAIALRYEHGKMESPQVIAKGAGMLANVMRAIAYKHHIPVVQNKPLARALYRQVDHENYVPIELYADVARIIVWVFAPNAQHRKGWYPHELHSSTCRKA